MLLERVAAFYGEFGELASTSALSPLGRRVRQLGGTKALSQHEAQCLVPVSGLDSRREEDFSPPPARVALLPLLDLRHVAALAGAALCREDVVRVVARREVQALCDVAGEAAHAFALGRAATYAGHAQRLQHQWQRPEVLAPTLAAQWSTLPLPERVMARGWWCVSACAVTGGASLLARVRTLLPQSGDCALAPEAGKAAWPLLRVLIFKELSCPWEGGWPSFFA